MSDRHLCKAKRTDNGKWIEGYYLPIGDKTYIICEAETESMDGENTDLYATEWYEVDPSTICQCPGYKGIWEHDIFQYDDDWYQIEYDVSLVWNAVSMSGSEVVKLGEFRPEEIDVIGNIFDNHELLEGGTE